MIFFELFITFFKIGLFTFGGGYAMLPLIQAEVESHGWIEAADLVNFIAVSESTPGPFAVNIATYVGMEMGSLLGAFCATLGVVLPSFIIILIVAKIYDRFRKNKVVAGCMTGLKPATVGLIAAAVISIGQTVLFPTAVTFGSAFWISLAIFAVMAVLAFKKAHPILIVCLSAGIGILIGAFFPQLIV